MKKLLEKNKKVLIILLILIIISGIIVISTVGFRKSPEYTAGTKIEVYIPKGYEKNDIMDIANKTFSNRNIVFYELEKLNQVACIKIDEYTEEELTSFKNEIAQKYSIEIEKLEIYEVKVPETRISSLVVPYVMPTIITTLVALVYIFIKNLKTDNKLKNVLGMLLSLVVVEGLYFSLIAIIRIPFGILTMPFALALFIITLLVQPNCTKN